MNQISTLSTFLLFGRTAVRRVINRSAAMKPRFAAWKRKAPATTDAPVRTATRHRSEQTSLLRRVGGMWLPIMSLVGMVGLSFNTMFVILGAVELNESRSAAVLHISQEHYDKLKSATAISNKEERDAEVERALASAFSSPTAWQTNASKQLAKERLDEKGMAAFATATADSRFSGTLANLSSEGRVRGMRAVGIYLAYLNLAMVCVAFGMMGKQLSGVDPTLVWLWQFPLSRRVLFSSKLVEYVFDNPTALVTALFYMTAMGICGTNVLAALGLGVLLGLAAGVTAAAVRLGVETFLTQRVSRRTRGAVVAFFAAFGSLAMLSAMIGSNAQFLVESFVKLANVLPAWCSWNPFTAGIGSDAMLNQSGPWYLVSPVTATVLAITVVLFAVKLTASGLACAQDSVRGTQTSPTTEKPQRAKFGIAVWKELLQMRRQPEFVGQVLATPIGICFMLYMAGYSSVLELATKGATNICVTILVACSYMLMVAASQMLSSELKTLWLLQCQPRPLADVIRSKARVWGVIAILISVPFIGGAIALLPGAAVSILIRVPFLFAALWMISELVFGLTVLAAVVTNEQTIRFRRGALLPLLVISNASVALFSQSWWVQLGSLAMMAILTAAVRERQLDELPWLSEPVETPPAKVYPMHAILALVAFQALVGVAQGALLQMPELSTTATVAISYGAAALVVSAVFWTWMSQNGLTKLPTTTVRGPALQPTVLGLTFSCVAGFVVTMFFRWWNVDSTVPAYAINGVVRSADYDKWCLLALWVVAAPLFEEWIVRGVLYRSLRRSWGVGLSVAVSSVLFATLHPAAGSIALVTLGVMTALAVEKTGRLWPSITIHAGYNFMIWLLWMV